MTELSKDALEIAKKRYFANENETWEECCKRISTSIAYNEEDKELWGSKFFDEIFNLNFIPGGRILRNTGKLKQSMMNCVCLPISDSIEAIGDTIKNSLIMWSYGAGIGVDFSFLRPKGVPLKNKGGESSGMVSFLEAINGVASTIETGGQRRSGMLALCSIYHPQVLDFIKSKNVDGKLPYFNLSVGIDNIFLQAVEEDKDWTFTFSGQAFNKIKAKDLWNLIIENAIETGDPGIINLDNLKKNNSYYFQNIECTNLCSEIPLPAYGSCCLGSLVLPSFLSGKSTNWKKLYNTINTAIRFLDDVIDINFYPIKRIEDVAKESRRIGLGCTGLYDYLLTKEIRYGSEKSLNEIERLLRFIRDSSYEASVNLAKEKGAFPKFNRVDYCNASFIRNLPVKLRMNIKENGIRNTCMLAAQPTGCLVDGTLVSSELGTFGIEKYNKLNNRIHNGVNSTISDFSKNNHIKSYYDQGFSDTKKIITKHGFEVEGTLNHKLRVLTSGCGYVWKKIEDIIEGDIVVLKKEFICNNNKSKFSDKTSELLGYYMADGWWTVSGRSYRLYFECSNENEASYIEKLIEEVFGNTFNIKIYKRQREGKSVRLEVNNKKLFDWFKDKSCIKNGALKAFIPYIILSGSKSNIISFIKGYYLGDGHLTKRDNRVGFTTISESLAHQLHTILLGLGILSHLVIENNIYPSKIDDREITSSNKVYRISVTKYGSYKLLELFGEKISIPSNGDRTPVLLTPDELIYFHPDNVSSTKKIMNSNEDIVYTTLNKYTSIFKQYNWFVKHNLYFDVVNKIKEYTNKHINDLEIFESSHTYVANGFITHNTTSLIAGVSSGIEPIFSLAYKRSDRISDRIYVHPKYVEYLNSNLKEKPDWLIDSTDLLPIHHLEVQSSIQKFLDNSISKTINCSKDTSTSDISRLLLESIKDLVGITIYRDGSKEGQILNHLTEEEAKKYIKNKKVESSLSVEDVACVKGTCEI